MELFCVTLWLLLTTAVFFQNHIFFGTKCPIVDRVFTEGFFVPNLCVRPQVHFLCVLVVIFCRHQIPGMTCFWGCQLG